MTLWWLSFADPRLPEGEQFLGVAIVEAPNIVLACQMAHIFGCNPGGEVAGWPIPAEEHVASRPHMNVLLSTSDLVRRGLSDGLQVKDLTDEQQEALGW